MTGIFPSIKTARLVLRGLTVEDADDVRRLAGAAEVAASTIRIPHPYERGEAEAWIGTHVERFEQGEAVVFGIEADGTLVGSAGLEIDGESHCGELGYWIGVPFWNRGYATEAAAAVLAYGFGTRGLHRIHAHCFAGNPASARVLEKVGMRAEGVLVEHLLKGDRYEDLLLYGVLAGQYDLAERQDGA